MKQRTKKYKPSNPVAKELQRHKHKVVPNKKKYFDDEMETALFDYKEDDMVFIYWDDLGEGE